MGKLVAGIVVALLAAHGGTAYAQDPYATLLATAATTGADEYTIGKEYLESELWLVGRWEDDAQQARVEGILRRIVAASDRPDLVYSVTLLDTDEVNASALPGGFVMVNRGLLTLMDDELLAFVLGHELSHVLLRHGANAVNVQSATAAALRNARGGDNRKAVEEQSRQLYLLLASHSRQLELEADLYGLLYTVRAGYPSAAAIDALKSLEGTMGGDIDPLDAPWASHPLFAERITQLELGVESIRATRGRFEAGLQLLRSGMFPEAAEAFQQFLTVFPHSTAGWANLGAAHLYEAMTAGEDPWLDVLPLHTDPGITVRGNAALARDRARDALGRALAVDPNDPVTLGLLGVLARLEGRLPEAQQLLERALATASDAAPLLVDLGNVAASNNQPDVALTYWTQARVAGPNLAAPLVNTARMYEKIDKKKKRAIEAWQVVAAQAPAWAAEASAQIARLSGKGAADAAEPAAPAGTRERFTGTFGAVAVGEPVEDVLTRLGTPDFDTGEGTSRVVGWDKLGLDGLVRGGRLIAWATYPPATVKTGAGIGLGSALDAVNAAYGAPSAAFELGAFRAYEWWEAGVGVAVNGADEVVRMDLLPPAP